MLVEVVVQVRLREVQEVLVEEEMGLLATAERQLQGQQILAVVAERHGKTVGQAGAELLLLHTQQQNLPTRGVMQQERTVATLGLNSLPAVP